MIKNFLLATVLTIGILVPQTQSMDLAKDTAQPGYFVNYQEESQAALRGQD